MRITYITAQAPWGRGETFLIEEMLAVKDAGFGLLILPRSPLKEVFHQEAKALLENTIWQPLINFKMIIVFLISLLTKPPLWKILGSIFCHSPNWYVLVKNLAVVPKGIYISLLLKEINADHIHAHWGSTTATMAWIISELTGIPWSFTLHRWDIKENNMLKLKVERAKFVRCISEHGRDELIGIIGNKYKEKIKVIHMGVRVPKEIKECSINRNFFTVVTPANLLEVKGHRYLIEACSILIKKGLKSFQVIFYGEGPLREELENLIKEKNLDDYIKMPGVISHENLLEMYKNREIDIVILPSITTSNGEHEGIPVALMEAMAYGIPVISTNTGGIPELIRDGSGIMVEEKNAEAMANAIESLIKNRNYYYEIGRKERLKVEKEFDIEKNVKALIELIKNNVKREKE